MGVWRKNCGGGREGPKGRKSDCTRKYPEPASTSFLTTSLGKEFKFHGEDFSFHACPKSPGGSQTAGSDVSFQGHCLHISTNTHISFLPFPFFFFYTWECATHTAPFLAFLLNNLLWLSLHISSPHFSSHLCQEVTFCCLSSPLSEDIYVVSDFLLYKLLQCLALNGWIGGGGHV